MLKSDNLFYGSRGVTPYPFLPFILTPTGVLQDNFVLAPLEISSNQDSFINALYAGFDRHRFTAPLGRIIEFSKQLCVAILVPTRLADEAGRSGLILCLGFVANREYRSGGDVLAAYLRAYIGILERHLARDITGLGADRIVGALQSLAHDNDMEERLALCKEASLIVSAAAGTWLPPRRLRLGLWRGARLRQTMIYGPSIPIVEAVCEVLTAASRGLWRGLQRRQTSDLWLLPWPTESWILENARRVKLLSQSGRPILIVERYNEAKPGE